MPQGLLKGFLFLLMAFLKGSLTCFKAFFRDSYSFSRPSQGIPVLFQGLLKGPLSCVKAFLSFIDRPQQNHLFCNFERWLRFVIFWFSRASSVMLEWLTFLGGVTFVLLILWDLIALEPCWSDLAWLTTSPSKEKKFALVRSLRLFFVVPILFKGLFKAFFKAVLKAFLRPF